MKSSNGKVGQHEKLDVNFQHDVKQMEMLDIGLGNRCTVPLTGSSVD